MYILEASSAGAASATEEKMVAAMAILEMENFMLDNSRFGREILWKRVLGSVQGVEG